MTEEKVLLRYGDRNFRANAKRLLNQHSDFNVLFCGWRAKFFLSSMPLLMHMQGSQISAGEKLTNFQVFACFLRLILLSPFMSIFWLAVANKKEMHLITKNREGVEITFVGEQ